MVLPQLRTEAVSSGNRVNLRVHLIGCSGGVFSIERKHLVEDIVAFPSAIVCVGGAKVVVIV